MEYQYLCQPNKNDMCAARAFVERLAFDHFLPINIKSTSSFPYFNGNDKSMPGRVFSSCSTNMNKLIDSSTHGTKVPCHQPLMETSLPVKRQLFSYIYNNDDNIIINQRSLLHYEQVDACQSVTMEFDSIL